MSRYYERSWIELIEELDQFISTAYFIPLAVGDALSVQVRKPCLKGLSPETVAGVFRLMDDAEMTTGNEEEPDPGPAIDNFFRKLKEFFPNVFHKWAEDQDELFLDPTGAYAHVLARCEAVIDGWLFVGDDESTMRKLPEIRRNGLKTLLMRIDPEEHSDDATLRRQLRERELLEFAAVARPCLYLDVWSEYVKVILDVSPHPVLKSKWPY